MIKTIYIYWHQGFAFAPDIVKHCLNSWRKYNPGWKLVCVDKTNLSEYIKAPELAFITGLNLNLTAYSDVVRAFLLKENGGVWVDSTLFCNKPLDSWLPGFIKEGFFAFERPGPDRLLSSWFLYSDSGSYIMTKWLEEVVKYYSYMKAPHTFFWFHYLFGKLHSEDGYFRELWGRVPKFPANGLGPRYLEEKGFLFKKINVIIKNNIDKKVTPVYKLSRHINYNCSDKMLVINYLFTTIPTGQCQS
jgi:hypothetical protein